MAPGIKKYTRNRYFMFLSTEIICLTSYINGVVKTENNTTKKPIKMLQVITPEHKYFFFSFLRFKKPRNPFRSFLHIHDRFSR